jgi:chromosome segregation ATPase
MGVDINSQGARIGALEQKTSVLETRAADNWKNLNGDIKELKDAQKELTGEVKDVKNSLSNIEGQMGQMQGTLGSLATYIEKVTSVSIAQENQQKEIEQIKEDVKQLKAENIEIRKSKITAWTSIAVAIIAGVFSIVTFFLKK